MINVLLKNQTIVRTQNFNPQTPHDAYVIAKRDFKKPMTEAYKIRS